MSCALLDCHLVTDCGLVGGCLNLRFPRQAFETQSDLRKGARVLAGEKAARPVRDPAKIQRKRKALRP